MALGLKSFSFFLAFVSAKTHNKTFHLFLLLFERKYILIELTTNLQPFYGLRLFWPIISHLHQSSALSQYLFFIQHSKKLLMRIEQMTPKVYKHFIRWNENRFGDFRIAIDFCFTYQRDLCVAIMLSFDCVWNVCVFFSIWVKREANRMWKKWRKKSETRQLFHIQWQIEGQLPDHVSLSSAAASSSSSFSSSFSFLFLIPFAWPFIQHLAHLKLMPSNMLTLSSPIV